MDAAANRRRLEPSCGDATLSRLHGDPTLSRLHERFGILVTLPTAGEHLVNAAELQALAATYGVVVLRNTANTPMAPQQIMDLAMAMGEAVTDTEIFCQGTCRTNKTWTLPSHPGLLVVTNDPTKGRKAGVEGPHSDNAYMATPARFSLLAAQILPDIGGETHFWSTGAAFASLSEPIQALCRTLRGVHTHVLHGVHTLNSPDDEPDRAEHPVALVVPETGAEALYVNSTYCKGFAGLSSTESSHILRMLLEHALQSRLLYRHTWMPGDVVIWDNWQTLHQAIDNYTQTRLCYRATTLQAPG